MKKLTFVLVLLLLMALLASCDDEKAGGDDGGAGLGDISVDDTTGDDGDDDADDGNGAGTDPDKDQTGDKTDGLPEGFSYTIWPEGMTLSGSEEYVLELAVSTLFLLKNEDWGALGAMVHPKQGLTFSPYGYVDESSAIRLGAGDVKALGFDEDVRTWGIFDGSGEPIEYTFAEYYGRFIFDRDFTKEPQVAIDRIIRTNLLENLDIFGNGASWVEFHIPGSGPEDDFNWASLRLVLGPYEGDLYLVAIIHDQWTI